MLVARRVEVADGWREGSLPAERSSVNKVSRKGHEQWDSTAHLSSRQSDREAALGMKQDDKQRNACALAVHLLLDSQHYAVD